MRLILSAVVGLAIAVPASASATVVPLNFPGLQDGLLVKVDGKGKHRGKGHGKGRRHDYDNWDDRRDERRAYREGYREGRREAYRDAYYEPGRDYGYQRYGRGQYLPREYRSYVVSNFYDYGYPPPPRGCHYVRVGQDTYLMQIATGLILNAFAGGRY